MYFIIKKAGGVIQHSTMYLCIVCIVLMPNKVLSLLGLAQQERLEVWLISGVRDVA